MEDTFVVVTFPSIQSLMDHLGFEDNCCLINDEPFLSEYGSSAYFVRESWLKGNNDDINPNDIDSY